MTRLNHLLLTCLACLVFAAPLSAQPEAAVDKRLSLYRDKSAWAQQRVKEGYDDQTTLWPIAQQLTEDEAARERLAVLLASQRFRVASYAGGQWRALLAYLKGEAPLE